MNVRVKYDSPKSQALRRLIEHGSGNREGLRALDRKIEAGDPGIRFSIHNEAGEVLIEGAFWGDANEMDSPLVSARILVDGDESPAFIKYADGKGYTFNKEYNAVIPDD